MTDSHAAAAGVPFRLQPFPDDPVPAGLAITGQARRDADRLQLHYRLSGAPQALLIPPLCPSPLRLDELWQSTCLEAFLARPADPGYRELNVSPAGHWNLYRLEAYRLGLTADPGVATAPRLERHQRPGLLELSVTLDLPPDLAAAPRLELGITAVIETLQGELSYWALLHPGEQADFHRREGFALQL